MTKNVLVIAAHADDEMIGCGGTIARHVREGDNVLVIVLAGYREDDDERAKKQGDALVDACNSIPVRFKVLDGVDQKFDCHPFLSIVQAIETEAKDFKPEIVYTHHVGDLNLDHRITHQAVLTAFRPLPGSTVKAIYGFEVRSSTEWGLQPFVPTHFVQLTRDDIAKKAIALDNYKDEIKPFPHSRSMLSIGYQTEVRGSEVGIEFAEAFTTIRTIS